MKKNKNTTPRTDLSRVMPVSAEAEQVVLGALMLESGSYGEIAGILADTDFYREDNRSVFKAIEDLHRGQRPVDMVTVMEELKRSGTLEQAGGPYYLSSLTTAIASASHIREHALIVKEKSILRQAIVIAAGLHNEAYSQMTDPAEMIAHTDHELEALMEKWIGQSNGNHLSVALKKATESMYLRVELARQNRLSGVDTGLAELNRITNGWPSSELIVLAARPGIGKTAMMLHFALAAARAGTPVAIFSLEMSDISLANRLILSNCTVDAEKYRSGRLSAEETEEIEKGMNELYSLPVYIDDSPVVTMSYIRHRCKILKKQGKCGLILVDYLQLGQSDEKENTRELEVSKMSRIAKVTAKELQIPYILLSQLNRSCESRSDKKPHLGDLRESGAIEQDADMVCFIHRLQHYGIKVFHPVTDREEINYGELIIAKNRNGPAGTVKFRHNSTLTRFYDYNTSPGEEFDAAAFDENPY